MGKPFSAGPISPDVLAASQAYRLASTAAAGACLVAAAVAAPTAAAGTATSSVRLLDQHRGPNRRQFCILQELLFLGAFVLGVVKMLR